MDPDVGSGNEIEVVIDLDDRDDGSEGHDVESTWVRQDDEYIGMCNGDEDEMSSGIEFYDEGINDEEV